MQHGNFTHLAKDYINRPAYSPIVLKALMSYVGAKSSHDFQVADVGAGTGKFTRMLLEKSLCVTAVEPNDAMRTEGQNYTKEFPIIWQTGSAENTNLKSSSINWLTMASSFHWTDPEKSLPEFHRVLKSSGYVTLIWNPRHIEASPLHQEIEDMISDLVPGLKRVSSGSKSHTQKWEEILKSTGHFKDVIFMESDFQEIMSKERYMGAWRSVNDIRVQAGEEKFTQILAQIENAIKDLEQIIVPYKIRAWTAQKS